MGSQATATMIEGILNEMLVPFRCECQLLKDASLVVCVHEPERPERCFTVAGISDSDCRSEAHVRQLAEAIRDDLVALVDRHENFPSPLSERSNHA
ncbi:DUF1652 domain-containing protein [Pseudomonas mangrovi]|uniref:DUF1652 domain-containing protein n=1 Tax=Pseudomonas mangrovi TaxID=2161748 RepID=A0A2T5P7X4_9PSED|nr:DUF1652 domain-containing protein [Pseudomonas mangrovi]PTU73785.1 hypothetical protein DBO85_15910 [Pseudomonas mangrovi]